MCLDLAESKPKVFLLALKEYDSKVREFEAQLSGNSVRIALARVFAMCEKLLIMALLKMNFQSPYLEKIYDVFQIDDRVCFVKDTHINLFEFVAIRGKDFEIAEVLKIMRSVCMGVKYLHKLGFIHRKINFKNILITNPGGDKWQAVLSLNGIVLDGMEKGRNRQPSPEVAVSMIH